jgi:putative ABC transport system substrate-binding protein
MKKHMMIVFSGFVGIGILCFLIFQMSQKKSAGGITIGIIQTASHPALDAACKGFKDALEKKLGASVTFVEQNAQGSVAQAHMIAQSFAHDSSIVGIYAIATMAAQAAVTNSTDKPIFIAAVTDPAAAGLVFEGSPVCGSSDLVDVKKEVDLIRQLTPQVKVVALLYNQGEINSSVLAQKYEAELQAQGYTVKHMTVMQEVDVPFAVDRALAEADCILAPTDNTVASTIVLIAQKALEVQKPLFVSDNMLVTYGALAAAGVDYYQLGVYAAQCAVDVLVSKKSVADVGIAKSRVGELFINSTVVAKLNIMVPEELKEHVHFVTSSV